MPRKILIGFSILLLPLLAAGSFTYHKYQSNSVAFSKHVSSCRTVMVRQT
ncbi:MAG TPA: hypothetical protein VIH74_00205 [Candidatus Acidoferrum sp.]